MVFYTLRISEITIIIFLFMSCKIKKTGDFDILLADPTVLHDNENYYLYGTISGGAGKTNDGFLVYKSDDLNNWKPKGFALKKGDAFGEKGFWAPHVLKNNDTYVMVYTADENIAIAFSKSPTGPFKNEMKTYFKTKEKQIDPFLFFENGKYFLFSGKRLNDGNQIFVSELTENLNSIKEGKSYKCLFTSQAWEDQDDFKTKNVQGASVIKIDGTYFMFYSANNFRSKKYAIGYATSLSPEGPWKKYNNNPIIDFIKINKNGPGHGDIFFDNQENKFKYVFHTHFSENKVRPRKTGMVNLFFDSKLNKFSIDANSFKYLKLE